MREDCVLAERGLNSRPDDLGRGSSLVPWPPESHRDEEGYMFGKRRRGYLRQAILGSQDDELNALQDELARKQERVADLELELFDAQNDLRRFEVEVEARLGVSQRRVAELEKELAQARRQAARRAQWGERAASPDLMVDSVDQFERAWRRDEPAEAPPPKPVEDEDIRAEVKSLYRKLAKRFHPDLTTDPAEKAWREGIMSEVNLAYAASDLVALRGLDKRPDRSVEAVPKTRDQILAEIMAEIERLDKLIPRLEGELRSVIQSPLLQLKLEATLGRRQGRDVLGEMASELRVEIARLEAQLASFS
jgi:hypothetical protein